MYEARKAGDNQARYVVGPALTIVDDPGVGDWYDTEEKP